MQLDKQEEMQARLEYDLYQWGHWSRDKGLHIDLSSGSENTMQPDITDEHALAIDRCIAILSNRDPVSATALKMKFVGQMSERKIEAQLRISRLKVRQHLLLGLASVAMALDMRAANDGV